MSTFNKAIRLSAVGIVAGSVALVSTACSPITTTYKLPARDVAAAISRTSGSVIVPAAASSADAESAAIATVNGLSVSVPRNPTGDIIISTADGHEVAIGLPDESQLGPAQQVDGTVAYPSKGASSSAVRANQDGGVQILTVIADNTAATRYAYPVSLPPGSHLEATPGGGVAVLAEDGSTMLTVAEPWAKDATGKPVPTHYEVAGNELAQVIDHRAAGFAYPITADPGWGDAFRATVRGTWNFLQCIVGVGVPIGLGWSILTNPSLAAWVAGRGPLPAGAGGFSYNYLSWIKRVCSAAING